MSRVATASCGCPCWSYCSGSSDEANLSGRVIAKTADGGIAALAVPTGEASPHPSPRDGLAAEALPWPVVLEVGYGLLSPVN